MKRSLLFAACLLLLVLGTSAAGGPDRSSQEPTLENAGRDLPPLAVGDQVVLGKNLILQAVEHKGVGGFYFSGKDIAVFFPDWKASPDVELPPGTGKRIIARRNDRIFLEKSSAFCRVNSKLPGALCQVPGATLPPYPCLVEVAGKKVNLVRFKEFDPDGKDETFEKCPSS